jgi:hypothetical protein
VARKPFAWKAEFETDLMGTVRTVNAAMLFLESRAAIDVAGRIRRSP